MNDQSHIIFTTILLLVTAMVGWAAGMVTLYLLLPQAVPIEIITNDNTTKIVAMITIAAIGTPLLIWQIIREHRLSDHRPTYRK